MLHEQVILLSGPHGAGKRSILQKEFPRYQSFWASGDHLVSFEGWLRGNTRFFTKEIIERCEQATKQLFTAYYENAKVAHAPRFTLHMTDAKDGTLSGIKVSGRLDSAEIYVLYLLLSAYLATYTEKKVLVIDDHSLCHLDHSLYEGIWDIIFNISTSLGIRIVVVSYHPILICAFKEKWKQEGREKAGYYTVANEQATLDTLIFEGE